MEKLKVGIIGATGMVGQRFIMLLNEHPYFEITALIAGPRSAGQKYGKAVLGRWKMTSPCPERILNMQVISSDEVEKVGSLCDFVFCTERGFIAVKPNCSIQSYVGALTPLMKYGIKEIVVTTYQAISGAGKTFNEWPEMIDNLIPFISGEEEKSEREPMRVWGRVENGEIVPAATPAITSQCLRVPVTDGHMAAVFVKFENKPSKEQILEAWDSFTAKPQELSLPSAPEKFITYFEEENRPQTGLDRDLYHGMGVSVGRLRADSIYDYKFVGLSHNTVRGAAGGAVLIAELLYREGYLTAK